MSWQKKLTEWQTQQLITAETAQAIQHYENNQPRLSDHLWRYGLMGLATLCLGLGLWFIVAANWQDIPFIAKLATHTLFNLGIAGVIIYLVKKDDPSVWHLEIPVLVLAAAQLSLMALIGQHFQLSNPFEDVMLYWFALMAPFLLLLGRTFFSGALFFGLGIYLLLAHLDIRIQNLFIPIITTLTGFYLASFVPWVQKNRIGWSQLMRHIGYYGIVILAMTLLFDPDMFIQKDYRYFASRQIGLHIGAALLLAGMTTSIYLRHAKSFTLVEYKDETEVFIFTMGSIALIHALLFSGSSQLFLTILFCLYFLGIGWIAQRYQKRGLICFAILAVAARLIFYFASLWNNLLLNGIVMIIIGGLTLLALRRFGAKKGKTA